MKFKHKNVLVYGMSVSGESVSKLLKKLRANVYLYDDDQERLRAKNIKGCYFVNGLNENLISQFDFIVVSPSIELDNPFIKMAIEKNIKIYSELEFSSLFCKKLVAVTGTNGKTTTVQLINAILSKKYHSIACGNIGYPLSKAVLEHKKAIKVAEVSSFMLEHAETFSPHVATILNIEPDHLIRHKSMSEYTRLKFNVFKNLTKKDFAVVNLDNDIHTTLDALIITYSYSHIADVYVKNGCIYLHNDKVIAINELKIKGKHNVYNVMCAICFAYIYKVPVRAIKEALINFQSEKYRIDFVASVNEINFYNDSKSTNISSTIACVDSIKGAIILLLGGSDKGLDYCKLFSRLSKRVVQIVAFGEIADRLVEDNASKFAIKKCTDMKEAFSYATANAKKNDNIVLSPASASYDQYTSYIERGKAFDEMVREYENSCKKK